MFIIRDIATDLLLDWDGYIDDITKDDEVYDLQFMWPIEDILTEAKRRSAYAGKYARNQRGETMIHEVALTADEQTMLEKWLDDGGKELYNIFHPYAQDREQAYQFDVAQTIRTFHDKGSITGYTTPILTDSTKEWTDDEHISRFCRIIGGDANAEEFTIADNAGQTLTFTEPPPPDEFEVEPEVGDSYDILSGGTSKDYFLYRLKIETDWDVNNIRAINAAVQDALIQFTLAKWYEVIGKIDSYQLALAEYQKLYTKIKALTWRRYETNIRRPCNLI